jgi:type III secretion protein U
MSGEKTEEASDHKLEESRKKGEVAKSQDVPMAFSMFGVVLTLVLMSDMALERLQLIFESALHFSDSDLSMNELNKRLGQMVIHALWISGPPIVVASVFAVLGVFAHVGLVISGEAVKPDFKKVDPVSGVKRIFSLRSLMELLQMTFKGILLGVVIWLLIESLVPMIAGSAYQSVTGIGTLWNEVVKKMLFIAVGIFVVLAPLDFAVHKWLFMRDQRMSKDDVKREYKEMEGDQNLKWARKNLAQEIAFSEPKKSVASANAVIVNPTHYAVAVRYDPSEHSVPVVVAKGVDEQALRIRQFANEAGVPIFSNPPLARALHKIPLDEPVPQELFEAVAAVLRWVDELAERRPDPTMQ